MTLRCVLILLCGLSLAEAAAPRISNRQTEVGEIGYRPADGAATVFNPPSLTWLHEKPALKYTVEWSTNAAFESSFSISNLPFNCYTHNQLLEPRRYFWRYRFQATNNIVSEWSVIRSFTIPTNAIAFPMPSVADCRTRLPKAHPRLFVQPEELPRLRELARGREKERFDNLRREADSLINKAPPAEPAKLGSSHDKHDPELIANWWPNRVRALEACTEAETLAFVYLITGDKKYGTAARTRVVELAKWNPDGATNFKLNCEAAKPMLHRISRAYDWAYDMFSANDRELIQQAIKRRIYDAWISGEVGYGVGHINRPYNSHGNRTWHKIGESGIVFLDEIPEADLWLNYALNKFYACYPVWSDDDGGWHEGGAYLGGYMAKAVWWLQVAKNSLNIDGFKKPFFAQVGDLPMYLAPPGSPNLGFGDLSYANHTSGWGGFMEFFIRGASEQPNSHAPYWRWWAEESGMRPETGVLGFLYNANLPQMPAAKAPTDLPVSKVFRGTGLASLHTTLLSSSNDVHLLFKSDPFGSQSHGHNPQNTFQLNAFGDCLITPCVYRDLHGSDFHEQWVHQTISQNGVLVDGKGQLPHSAKAAGKISSFELTPGWDYVVGDAVGAYEGRLQRFNRHILFAKPDLVLIYDDLVATQPSQFQFMLHALSPFSENKELSEWRVEQPHSGLIVKYLTESAVRFRQWDGLKPKSIRGTFPNQWHLQASTRKTSTQCGMLTLLLPYKGKTAPQFSAHRVETRSAVGVEIKINGKNILMAFRKAEVQGEAELAGERFNSAVLVK